MLVDIRIEQALAASFGGLATALVEGDVGDEAIIEAHFASGQGVKACIGIEESALEAQAEPFHRLEGGLKMGFEMVGIVMVASDDPSRSHDEAIGIRDGQDVGGLGFLAALIRHRFAAFLGDGVAAVQVEFR